MRLRPVKGDSYRLPFNVKKNLNLQQLLKQISSGFYAVPDKRQSAKCTYQLHDVMMGALSCMFYQEPSWLQYQQRLQDECHQNNLFSLFGMSSIPKESQMRELLDEVDSEHYRPVFKNLFEALRRDKQLERFRQPLTPSGLYYVAIDGSQYHSSTSINCEHCLTKAHKKGTVYQHQTLQVALMHPDCRQVIPMMPEAIANTDGNKKQDCEQNAMKRLLVKLKETHPRLPFLIGGDSLFAHSPTIELLTSMNMAYLFTCKLGDHKYLMNWLSDFSDWPWLELKDNQQRLHRYRWRNNVPLKDCEQSPRVNYFEYELINAQGKVGFRSSWITSLEITRSNIERFVKTGRCRWKIENECFNTLKNQGYHMDHNYGHGKKYLSNNMYLSTLLAFTLHQILELTDEAYQQCRERLGSKQCLWEKIRVAYQMFIIPDWYWLMAWLLTKNEGYFEMENLNKQ